MGPVASGRRNQGTPPFCLPLRPLLFFLLGGAEVGNGVGEGSREDGFGRKQ